MSYLEELLSGESSGYHANRTPRWLQTHRRNIHNLDDLNLDDLKVDDLKVDDMRYLLIRKIGQSG